MNPNLAYQLHEAQRPRPRGQIIAEDAERGRRAAARSRTALSRTALSRAYRALAGRRSGVAPWYRPSRPLL